MSLFKIPDKPYEDDRVVSTRITPELHKDLRELAARCDCSVAALIKAALQTYVVSKAQ